MLITHSFDNTKALFQPGSKFTIHDKVSYNTNLKKHLHFKIRKIGDGVKLLVVITLNAVSGSRAERTPTDV